MRRTHNVRKSIATTSGVFSTCTNFYKNFDHLVLRCMHGYYIVRCFKHVPVGSIVCVSCIPRFRCYENFIQHRAMRRAQDVRKQLVTIMDRYKLPIVSCGKHFDRVRRAICSGYFQHAAKKDPQEGYKYATRIGLVVCSLFLCRCRCVACPLNSFTVLKRCVLNKLTTTTTKNSVSLGSGRARAEPVERFV